MVVDPLARHPSILGCMKAVEPLARHFCVVGIEVQSVTQAPLRTVVFD